MGKKILPLTILFCFMLTVSYPASVQAGPPAFQASSSSTILPENTIILSNEMDGRFSRDYSVILKYSRLEWIILESPAIPQSIQDSNLILLGSPDAAFSGEIMRELLSPEELAMLDAGTDQGAVIQIESPWREDRSVIICSGESPLAIRDAAESALRALIAEAPPTSDWLRSAYQFPLNENLQNSLDTLRYSWQDQELSVEELALDVAAETKGQISSEQAQEDAARLFYLLSHGYGGYGFFNQDGKIDQARSAALEELSGQSSWTVEAFSKTLQEHLSFINDCHLAIGEQRFAEHSDFWYDTKYELTPEGDGFYFTSRGKSYRLVAVNGGDPEPYLFPSLNREGNAVYRLGALSADQPPALQVLAANDRDERTFTIPLKQSDFDYYSKEIFREDSLGGIPVIRARGFGDYHREELSLFPPTASQLRGAPAVIVDIRGNTGGNESWPISWIQRLTGQRPQAVFATSELKSTTSLMGRANAFDYWIQTAGIDTYQGDYQNHRNQASAVESGDREASWTGPFYPPLPLIPNQTTLVVVTNDQVASAGEGFVLRSSQLENILVVGENTMGCLTFGNISAHKLPQSNLLIWMPINFGIFLDGQIREGVGLAPDLWVPAADAVNYAVAGLRAGTISTALPLSPETQAAKFIPESAWSRSLGTALLNWPVVATIAGAAAVLGYIMRHNAKVLLTIGGVWCVFGLYWILVAVPGAFHLGLFTAGIISLGWGVYSLLAGRRSSSGGEV